LNFYVNFFKENKNLVPEEIISKIEKLISYDISPSSKYSEMELIISNFESSLGNDERLKLDQDMENKMKDYYKIHKKELQKTGILKLELDGLNIAANGIVSGSLLNQFSLDEYGGNLRVATTIGGNFWGWGTSTGTNESTSDVYILNSNLEELGEVNDLGAGERIYSARFVEDKGYIVTFKQIDPFYVLDLSNPENPNKVGELKIPGYSSYLHPISKDLIIGIGKEDNQMKISLFEVSDPSAPREVSKYNLNEYWSDILNTHHAFLLDKDHEIFFMPGSQGGYIFSYKDNEIKLEKAIKSDWGQVIRAIYINDLLYVISDAKITVLNENNWEKVKELEL
jgi:inhibitor of cysteine peptidase